MRPLGIFKVNDRSYSNLETFYRINQFDSMTNDNKI